MRRIMPPSLAALLLLVTLSLTTGCPVVAGSASLTTQDFDLDGFNRVQAESSFDVEIVQGASYTVEITVNDNLKDYLRVSKNGDTLVLSVKSGYSYLNSTFRARVIMPNLRKLEMSGASRAIVTGFIGREDLDVNISGASSASFTNMKVRALDSDVSGAGTLSGDMDASSFANVRLSGASTAELNGRAENLSAFASGASSLRLGDFAVGDVHFDLSGASNGTLNASGTISGRLSGASHLSYLGNPSLGDINTCGGSSISRA
jgi:hypothetical protein